MSKIKRILLPVAFSENDLLAAEYAQDIAKCSGAEIVLLHITRPSDFLGEDILQTLHKDYVSYEKEAADNLMDAFIKKSLEGARVTGKEVIKGNPSDEILRYALHNDIQMIVIATHCRRGLETMFVGSVAERVIKKASCPVLAVHPPCRLE